MSTTMFSGLDIDDPANADAGAFTDCCKKPKLVLPPEEPALKVKTAFLIVQHENGEWEAASHTLDVEAEHPASVTEMSFGASQVLDDIRASKLAAFTAHQFVTMSQQAAQQAQSQAIASKLKL